MTSHRLPALQDPSSTTDRFWEASFKEMAAENEDWSDMEPAMGDGFAALEGEERMAAG